MSSSNHSRNQSSLKGKPVKPPKPPPPPSGPGVYAYVGCRSNVSIIDTISQSLSGSITMNNTTHRAAVDFAPDSSKMYMCNFETNNVSTISIPSNVIDATLQVGPYPSGIAVSPDGAKAYVAVLGAGNNTDRIRVLDLATNTIAATWPVPQPSDVALSSDGIRVFVVTYENLFKIYDSATGVLTNTISLAGIKPLRVLINNDNSKAYIIYRDSSFVSVIDLVQNVVLPQVYPVGLSPFGGTLSSDDAKLYVANGSSNTVTIIDLIAGTTTDISGFSKPFDVAVDANNTFAYVTNMDSGKVDIIDLSNNARIKQINVGRNSYPSFVRIRTVG